MFFYYIEAKWLILGSVVFRTLNDGLVITDILNNLTIHTIYVIAVIAGTFTYCCYIHTLVWI